MAKALHAIDYLSKPEQFAPRPVCAVFGDEPFLHRRVLIALRDAVLQGEDAEFSNFSFDGKTVEFRDVLEELSTFSMFGAGRRFVTVDRADDLVTRARSELEKYVVAPKKTGVLALELRTLPANTKLYKLIAEHGLLIDGSCPNAGQLKRWLTAWSKSAHRTAIAPGAADLLLELVGAELGLLDQELAKLALLVDPDQPITPELVQQSVGSWRAKTTWEMLDLALEGRAGEAIVQLDRLLLAGEAPIGILAQVSSNLRRLASATRIILDAERQGRRASLSGALEQAGVKSFVLRKSEQQLRKLGRRRGGQLYRWLLEADLGLKGDSRVPPRQLLEMFLVRLASPEMR